MDKWCTAEYTLALTMKRIREPQVLVYSAHSNECIPETRTFIRKYCIVFFFIGIQSSFAGRAKLNMIKARDI